MFASTGNRFLCLLVIFALSQISPCAAILETVPRMKEFLVRTYQEVENTLKEEASVLKQETIRYAKVSEDKAATEEDVSCIKASMIKHVRDIEALPLVTEKCFKYPKWSLFNRFVEDLLTPEEAVAMRTRLLSSFQRCLNLGISQLGDVRDSFKKMVNVCLN